VRSLLEDNDDHKMFDLDELDLFETEKQPKSKYLTTDSLMEKLSS